MSTDKLDGQDGLPNPAPQSDSQTPAAEETNPQPLTPVDEHVVSKPEDAAESAPSSSAEAVETESQAEESDAGEQASAESKRKIQLRPNALGSELRAVPSLGASENAPVVNAQPVAIPQADDSDVEAEVKNAVVAMNAPQSPPAAPSAPVAIPEQEAIDASLEAAIEEAMSGGAAVGEGLAPPVAPTDIESLQRGQKLQGTVQAVSGDSVLLDLGLRLSGAVPFRQFDPKKVPNIGDVVEVAFERIDDAEGLILANLPRGTSQIQGGNWDAVAPDQVVECMVSKTNKGGLEVMVSSLRGFIPASQVDLYFVSDLQTFVGQKLRAKVTEVNPAKRRLVLSRRSLLQEEREVAKQELLTEIKPDQVLTGRVKTIKEYGAFVDLGGMDGFLPIAQMSWVRIEHPNEVLSEGQQIEVKVLSIDREKNRISLGMRQLSPNPWRSAETKYAKGVVVTGRVTRLEAFGAFVELEPGIEGLVHISELDHRRVRQVSEVLNPGDMAEVQVLEVDPKKKRVSLSVKALKAKPEPVERPKDEDLAPGKGESYERKRRDPLKGGTGSPKGGGLFGNPQDFT